MNKLLLGWMFATMVVVLGAACSAQTGYHVISNDGSHPNTATVFKLQPATGNLSLETVLSTGGLGNDHSTISDFSATIAASPNGSCLFVADELSSDIAAYATPAMNEIGKYDNSQLNAVTNPTWGDAFMTLAENGAGTILYATYGGSNNVAVWAINKDCSLTLANVYDLENLGDYGGGLVSMTVSPDGSTLVGSWGAGENLTNSYVGSWTISGTTLTDNGPVLISVWPKGVGSVSVTNDGSVAVMPTISNGLFDNGETAVVTASLPGFTNQKLWILADNGTDGLVLSADAAAGKGCMYVSQNIVAGGTGSPGVLGATFNESPLSIVLVNTAIYEYDGRLQPITNKGNAGGVYGLSPYGSPSGHSAIDVYSASANCALKFVSHNSIPTGQNGGFNGITSWAPSQ
jgi:hypothetical protein